MSDAAEAAPQVAAVLGTYLDGLHHSDAEALRSVFHPRAIYACATSGELVFHTMDTYLPMVAARPSPASRNEARADHIDGIELIGPVTAVARLRCAIGTRHFDDVLTLVQLDGRWQIMSKVFHYTAAHEES